LRANGFGAKLRGRRWAHARTKQKETAECRICDAATAMKND
jgi:hypothetical protein